jgi:hypothetical protein
MELGGVIIFEQGMKFGEEKGSLGVTGRWVWEDWTRPVSDPRHSSVS